MSEATRAQFLAGSAALVIGIGAGGTTVVAQTAPAAGPPGLPPSGGAYGPPLDAFSSWLKMLPDGTVEVYTDKVDLGMGTTTAFQQIVAEELDVAVASVRMIVGDNIRTPDQGGIGSSTSIEIGAKPLRGAAAQARALLVNAAAARLGVPAATLTVADGTVSGGGKSIRYRELIDALAAAPKMNVKANPIAIFVDVTSAAPLKSPADYRVVGTSVKRDDIKQKVFANFTYAGDIRVPGMVHARVIRPPQVSAAFVAADAASIAGFGDARVVHIGDFLAVVATKEWNAIRAARALKVTWSAPATDFGTTSADVAEHLWAQPPSAQKTTVDTGTTAAALAAAPQVLEATYTWPFQSAASMGAGCAVADVKGDTATVWSGTQKPHALNKGLGDLLGIPAANVRVIYVSDAGSYGRNGYDDTAADAALISRAIGKPVRVQWMRHDMTQWGPKGPAFVAKMRGTADSGGIDAVEMAFKAYNLWEIFPYPDTAGNLLAGQLLGKPNVKQPPIMSEYGSESGRYAIPNVRATTALVKPMVPLASPLRGGFLRDPNGPAVTFALESFVDELAAQAGADPVEFRLKHLADPRHREVVQRAADAAHWVTHIKGTGRGIAFATRGRSLVATVAYVSVDRKTGRVRVNRLVCAHDCGLIVNPQGLKNTIEANLVQSASRALFEEVQFTKNQVTSVDWLTYPVSHMADIPKLEVVMIDRRDLPPTGAGEPATRTTAAAIANAVADATGVRVRSIPLTPARVLAAMNAAHTRA